MRLLILFGLFLIIQISYSEYFSSVYHMETLIESERFLIDSLDYFISEEEILLLDLKERLESFRKSHKKASEAPLDYLSNPVNEYLLIKRLFMEWHEVDLSINLGPLKVLQDNYKYLSDNQMLPTAYDIGGAAEGIFRLQETYGIDAKNFSKGTFDGMETGIEMSGRDCFDLGYQAYNGKNYERSSEWLEESYQRSKIENKTINWVGLLDALSTSYFQIGDIEKALNISRELEIIAPENEKAKMDTYKYESILYPEKNVLGYELTDEKGGEIQSDPFIYDEHEFLRYLKVCRGELQQSLTDKSKLKCYYKHDTHPSLKIGPVKVEDINLDPHVVIFHDVLFDSEITQMINTSKTEIHRSQVVGESYGQGMVGEYRVSQSTGISANQHSFLEKLDNRIEAITALSTISSEGHQVANYGIGGHYEPHLDFTSKYGDTPLEFWEQDGNRIATLVFYLTDVIKGGATAFPYLNTRAQARKGTALFWHNLYKDGEGNYLTRHAACPVLLGNKWSSNVWLRERGQEFRRSCELHPDHEPDDVWISLLGK